MTAVGANRNGGLLSCSNKPSQVSAVAAGVISTTAPTSSRVLMPFITGNQPTGVSFVIFLDRAGNVRHQPLDVGTKLEKGLNPQLT